MKLGNLDDGSGGHPSGVAAIAARLMALLDELYRHVDRLQDLADRKLDALRAADAATLQKCSVEEARQLEALFRQEGQRDAVLARLAQSLHAADGRRCPLRELVREIPEPYASQITAKTVGLRVLSESLKRKNDLAARVARGLHTHIRSVFAAVAEANQETVVYGSDGRHEPRNRDGWVDAVG